MIHDSITQNFKEIICSYSLYQMCLCLLNRRGGTTKLASNLLLSTTNVG